MPGQIKTAEKIEVLLRADPQLPRVAALGSSCPRVLSCLLACEFGSSRAGVK